MSILNCVEFAWKLKWHWNKKLLSLLGSLTSTTKNIENIYFSSSKIRYRTGDLISIKYISNTTEDISQFFISWIITVLGF